MGNSIKPETLYGKPLGKLDAGDGKDPNHSTAQAKIVDNRIVYVFKKNDTSDKFYLPPLIMESSILYNATNSIGPIYAKDYSPNDGRFHLNNEGFETGTGDYVMRNATSANVMNVDNRNITNLNYKSGKTSEYDHATIDNTNIGSLRGNPGTNFMGSVGVGIIPLLNPDGNIEDALLNIMVETYIDVECASHGTNLLMSEYNKPQPNTMCTGVALSRKAIWEGQYTVAGHAAMKIE